MTVRALVRSQRVGLVAPVAARPVVDAAPLATPAIERDQVALEERLAVLLERALREHAGAAE